MRKDKQRVEEEAWDEARIAGFLDMQPGPGASADHHVLLMAYRGMRAADFVRLVALFVAAGRDLDAVGPEGMTLLQEVETHRHGAPYAAVLREFGAQ
jgi:putative intracellular protease/amidase